ncbi:MAG: hypothetical protein JO032_12110 [Alphaproteobacteria bacterium]|nr:hypothetical protein [Alphaproteobacteria bacterium]
MRSLFCTCIAAAAMVIALPMVAAAQSSAYDGAYVGVSGSNGQGGTVNCPAVSAPAPLTISGGAITSSVAGSFEGTVGADGRVVLHGKGNIRYDGKIEGGALSVGGGTSRCTFNFVWRKR